MFSTKLVTRECPKKVSQLLELRTMNLSSEFHLSIRLMKWVFKQVWRRSFPSFINFISIRKDDHFYLFFLISTFILHYIKIRTFYYIKSNLRTFPALFQLTIHDLWLKNIRYSEFLLQNFLNTMIIYFDVRIFVHRYWTKMIWMIRDIVNW